MAIYLPRINRTLVDQLESHLRSFSLTAANIAEAEDAHEPMRALVVQQSKSVGARGSSVLRADQLESTLSCVKQAAGVMAKLVERAGLTGERERLETALAKVEDRLGVFERTFEAMSDELHEARRDAEEQRRRARVAEDRLENLMEAVTKMIAPLSHQDSYDPDPIPPTGNAPSRSYGVRA